MEHQGVGSIRRGAPYVPFKNTYLAKSPEELLQFLYHSRSLLFLLLSPVPLVSLSKAAAFFNISIQLQLPYPQRLFVHLKGRVESEKINTTAKNSTSSNENLMKDKFLRKH